MKLFSQRRNTNRLNGPLPVDPETGLYSQNFFLLRLKEERERTNRTGIPFSLIVVDIDGISTALKKKSRVFTRVRQTNLVKVILRKSRKIDTKGWIDLKRVGILMPNTTNIGALEFKAKIHTHIRFHWPSTEKKDLEEFIRVATFGDNSSDGNCSALNGDNGGGGSLEDNFIYADILSSDFSCSLKRFTKRTFDILGSLLGIIITSPFMFIIAVVIKLTSSGPILFRQERVGFLGQRFVFLKFRSMVVNADPAIHEDYVTNFINGQNHKINHGKKDHPVYKINHDPRVTRFGRFLRKTSLDELPQLFNIVMGEMSLVGPRPLTVYEFEHYKLWHYGRITLAKPGLTGLWQVTGRSKTTFDDMVRLDIQYADNWSLWLDIKIILKTFRAVLSAEGAY